MQTGKNICLGSRGLNNIPQFKEKIKILKWRIKNTVVKCVPLYLINELAGRKNQFVFNFLANGKNLVRIMKKLVYYFDISYQNIRTVLWKSRWKYKIENRVFLLGTPPLSERWKEFCNIDGLEMDFWILGKYLIQGESFSSYSVICVKGKLKNHGIDIYALSTTADFYFYYKSWFES